MSNIFSGVNEDNTVPSDVAMAAYIAANHPSSQVSLIDGSEILKVSASDLNAFDVVVVIYDPVEVFYCESKTGTCPHISQHLEKITRATKAFVLPPPDFHGHIIHKHLYYADLQRAGVPVVPFFGIKFATLQVKDLVAKVKAAGWKGIIIKPSYAGYSMGIRVFRNFARTRMDTLQKYISHMRNLGYPDATVQEFVPSFGSNYEIRTYWINGRFSHAVGTLTEAVGKDNSGLPITDVTIPESQGGKIPDSIIRRLKPVARQALKALPTYKYIGHQPLVRVDFGCCRASDACAESYFVNEVETMAANLLAEYTPTPVVEKVAAAIYNFALRAKRGKWRNTRGRKSTSPRRKVSACKRK